MEQNITATAQTFLSNKQQKNALPPQQTFPINEYVAPNAGSWRETNDLVEVGSVTDNTTKLLQKEEDR